jgi:2-phospho-L-lactate/phosphoenolpyruvate guanylyltransferase
MDAGLLPVKRLDRAKGRLSGWLDPAERTALARALFDDALDLCSSAPWLRWWVVSDDEDVRKIAAGRGFETVADEGTGLNDALKLAISAIVRDGAETVTVIPSDVPLAYQEDIRDLVDTGATSDIVVVPSDDDGGTNGLFLSPPDLIDPRFGSASLKAHVDAAADRGLRCSILALPRLALDIDTIGDVDAFLERPAHAPSHARDLLTRLRPAGT